MESFLAQVPLGAGPQEVHAEPVQRHLCPVSGEEDLLGRLLLLVLPLHDGDVPLCLEPPAAQFVILLVLHVFGLEVEEDLASVVALVQEIQVVQHGGVVEHVVHDLVAEEAAELTDQLEGELVGRVDLPSTSLPLRLLPLLGQLVALHGLLQQREIQLIQRERDRVGKFIFFNPSITL